MKKTCWDTFLRFGRNGGAISLIVGGIFFILTPLSTLYAPENPNFYRMENCNTIANLSWHPDFDTIIQAMIQVESRGNPFAKGKHGEKGLMQIKKITWRTTCKILGEHYDYNKNVYNGELNQYIGSEYYRWITSRLINKGYSENSAWRIALRVYNAGLQNATKGIGFKYLHRIEKEITRLNSSSQ